jgi:hypothetical protein
LNGFLTTPSSANLAAAVTDPTGSGSLVFATSGSLTTPNLINPTITNFTESIVSVSGTSITIDLTQGTIWEITTTGNLTINLPNVSPGKAFTVSINYTGTHTVTWAGGALKWPGGTAPTPTSAQGKVDIFRFTQDGLSTYGDVFGQNYNGPTTWSVTNKAAGVTLTSNNLVATADNVAAGDFGVGLANKNITTGNLIYLELVAGTYGSNTQYGVGVGNASITINPSDWLGFDSNSLGFFADGRVICSSTLTTLTGYSPADVVCLAIDFTHGTIWRRINSGQWNDSGTADPSTNTGGISTTVTGDLYPAYGLHNNGSIADQVTMRSTPSFTVPSGFTYYGS